MTDNNAVTKVNQPVQVMMKDPKMAAAGRDWLSGTVGIKKSWPRSLNLRRANLI